MTDRPLGAQELSDLRSGLTLTKLPYFITVFKHDVTHDNGRQAGIAPSLYEMVLLELIAKLEVQQELLIRQALKLKNLEDESRKSH